MGELYMLFYPYRIKRCIIGRQKNDASPAARSPAHNARGVWGGADIGRGIRIDQVLEYKD